MTRALLASKFHPVPPPQTEQDKFLNPFTWQSAFHRPIGTGAIYAQDGDAVTTAWNLRGFGTINYNNGYGAQVYQNDASDPSRTVTAKSGSFGIFPVTLNMPTINAVPETFDNEVILWDMLGDNGLTIHEFYSWSWNGGAPKAIGHRTYSIIGTGHAASSTGGRVGNTASGISIFCGLIRGWELSGTSPILHAGNQLLSAGGQYGPQQLKNQAIWPGSGVDGFCGDGTHCLGQVPYGALFALPPTVDINSLGLSALGLRVAAQMRDYGTYVMDNGSNSASRGDQTLTSTQADAFKIAMKTIYPRMRMVMNNNPPSVPGYETAAGGGTPIATNGAFDAP